jgi:transposase
MTLAIDELPDDVAALKQFIVVREQQLLSERDELIARIKEEASRQLEAERAARQAAIDEAVRAAVDAAVQAAVAAILRRYYGPRSERFDPRQLLLFGQRVDQLPLDEASIAEEAGQPLVTRRVKNRHEHGRQQLPEHLERIEIEHDLEDKACPACGNERCRIGEEVSEQLEYFPASFKVLKHIRHKYACTKCDQDGYDPHVATAAKPPQPIEKGLPGPSLLAYVAVSKLGDHLPPTNRCAVGARGWNESSSGSRSTWPAARCAPGCGVPASS